MLTSSWWPGISKDLPLGGRGGMDIFLEPHIFTGVKLCLKCQIFHHSLHLGTVQTLCSGTSAWVPAQSGVVFTLWVPDIWRYTWLLHFALSDFHFETWAWEWEQSSWLPGTYKNCVQTGTQCLLLCWRKRSRPPILLGHRHHVRILVWVLEKMVRSH